MNVSTNNGRLLKGLVALAMVCASAQVFGANILAETFETYTDGDPITDASTWSAGSSDLSTVLATNYTYTASTMPLSASAPGTAHEQVLDLATEGDQLTNDVSTTSNPAGTITNIYIDQMVYLVPSDETPYSITNDLSIQAAVYLNSSSNLVILSGVIEEQIAFLYGGNEGVISVSRLLKDFTKKNKNLKACGGDMDGALLDTKDIQDLADMPTRTEMIGQVMAQILSAGGNIVAAMQGPGGAIAGCVKTHADNLEKGVWSTDDPGSLQPGCHDPNAELDATESLQKMTIEVSSPSAEFVRQVEVVKSIVTDLNGSSPSEAP